MTAFERISPIMDANHIFGECVEDSEVMCAIEIAWGDWKHEHLCLEWAVKEVYPNVQHSSAVTEEDGSDCYSAVHYFIFV